MRMAHGELGILHDLRALLLLLEERNVTRAAVRFHLGQSSMSRTLQRLRAQFGDELLVRTRGDYELTPRGREIHSELAQLVPRLEDLVAGRRFDPATATGTVRLIGTDYTLATIGHHLLPRLLLAAPGLEVRFETRDAEAFADLERGRGDLAMSVMQPSPPLRWERLFTDDVVCVVDADHPVGERFSLDEYVAARHVVITVVGDEQPMIVRWLQTHGRTRTAAFRVAYFTAALVALPSTPLVATIPRRHAEVHAARDPRLRLVEAPEQFDAIPYGMIWHPRLDSDPMHQWVRALTREAAREMTGTPSPTSSSP